jgi:uncharacterized protein (TIGR02757 family)
MALGIFRAGKDLPHDSMSGMSGVPPSFSRAALDELYCRFNRQEFIHPDPLEFVHNYENPLDREVVGIIASSLAYGRVNQILKSVSKVLALMGPSPSSFLRETSPRGLHGTLEDFKHRFTTGEEIASLLVNMKRILKECGSLQDCFLRGLGRKDCNILPALAVFVERLNGGTPREGGMLLPSPLKGSACKRLNLFLRWMVRRDEVDPGVWTEVEPSILIVPLDTHMHRISRTMALTTRKQADIRTALEITRAFGTLNPEDPVRYDFALTRLGIRPNNGH